MFYRFLVANPKLFLSHNTVRVHAQLELRTRENEGGGWWRRGEGNEWMGVKHVTIILIRWKRKANF